MTSTQSHRNRLGRPPGPAGAVGSLRIVSAWFAAIFLAACASPGATTDDRLGGPQAWIDAPLSGEALLLDQAPFEVLAHANDPAGLDSMEFAVNGQPVGSSDLASGDDPYFQSASFAWSPPAAGEYLLTITAFDSLGNPGPVASASVSVVAGKPTSPEASGTPTVTPTATEVAGACTFTATINLFCRAGPGQGYEDIDSFTPGMMAPVIGESTDGLYWYVTGPYSSRLCTVPQGERFGSVTGDCGELPVFTPIPLPPTATPTPTATPCVGPDCG